MSLETVEIYSSTFCTTCNRAKELLARKGVAFAEIEVSVDSGRRREMTERSGGRTTIPQVFIGGAHAGGYQELLELDRRGRLGEMLGVTR
ncbi:MAG: glutaredoxin 3 [Alphaproteobacteria bacterium]